MIARALRNGVLSLLCYVGVAAVEPQAKQQNCFIIEPDEINLDFSGAHACP